LRVYVEATDKKAFACSVDWPGWCRSGKDAGAALERLLDYQERYAEVVRGAGLAFDPGEPQVIERIAGNATTTFGAPGVIPTCDVDEPVSREAIAVLKASWQLLADVAATAPAELRKGPRGGGRDRDKVVQHVAAAEASYARKIGVKHKEPAPGDAAAVQAMRADIVDALASGVTGNSWPPAYFVRRTAWHVLDHAWEIQDRSE
jgi:hypothetical protein